MRVLNTRTLCAVKELRYQMHLKYVRNRLKEKKSWDKDQQEIFEWGFPAFPRR